MNADQFQFAFSIFVLAMVILGGLGSIWGVVIGAVALSFVNSRLIPDVLGRRCRAKRRPRLRPDRSSSSAIFGFLLVMMMVLRPEGLMPERRRKIELGGHRRRRDPGVCDEPRPSTRRGLTPSDGAQRRRRPETCRSRRRSAAWWRWTASNFSIPEKSIVSIIGPNGAGKTTFFNMLTGLYRPTAGRIVFEGRDITGRAAGPDPGAWAWRARSRTSACSRP